MQLPFISNIQASSKRISEELYKKNWELNSVLQQTKALTESLQHEKNIREQILENIIDIVMMLDTNNNILTVNRAFEREFDLPKERVLGKAFDEVVEVIIHQDKVSLLELLQKDLTTVKGETKTTEMIKVKAGEHTIYATVHYTPVDGEGGAKYTLITIHDKTKDYELEQMKLDFVSMAAHELRTPLTAIRGYASILGEELTEPSSVDQLRQSVDRIMLSADNLGALIENILSLTKIEKGAVKLNRVQESWQQCINEVIALFDEQIRAKKQTLQVVSLDKQVLAAVDKLRINEVLSNLLANAITYTPEGGTITVSSQILDDHWIKTTVKDTGIGIDKNAQKHMFEKFFRVEGPLIEGKKGNGLGLYISKNIVEMHGGQITVESEGRGKGTIFSYTVPRA